jgi:L-serine dehydratase
MFISVLDLYKIGIGPSSSHTMGPMVAAVKFRQHIAALDLTESNMHLKCVLKGSLAYTGKGHASDRAVALGIHGYLPHELVEQDVNALVLGLWESDSVDIEGATIRFSPEADIIFDRGEPLPQHPNGMIFQLMDGEGTQILEDIYFSIGGGFISTLAEINSLEAPLIMEEAPTIPYPFESALRMLDMSRESGLSIAKMKRQNEHLHHGDTQLDRGMNAIWTAMRTCIERGLSAEGILPGGLNVKRRAHALHEQLIADPAEANQSDWLCAYAMAVNEENAAGHMVVTAPTNGAAGVIPAVLYYLVIHKGIDNAQIQDYLLTSAAIGGLIKHRSSISGAEVGCQGEVGSAAAMAAAGLCAVRGGSTLQIENAAEIALEHHLGLTCDPVRGLVQVPCIERNGFGAIKAFTAASLAMRGDGLHFMSLDNCIAAMKQTGEEMSLKFKETSLGGLAVSITEC